MEFLSEQKWLTSHLEEFFVVALDISVFVLHGMLDSAWNEMVNAQHTALYQLDFSRSVSPKPPLWLAASNPVIICGAHRVTCCSRKSKL